MYFQGYSGYVLESPNTNTFYFEIIIIIIITKKTENEFGALQVAAS